MKTVQLDRPFDRLAFLGDIHGEFNVIRYKMRTHGLRNTLIFQVGDFGIGMDKPGKEKQALEEASKDLEARNCFLVAIRGNHDDPSYFNNQFYKHNILLLEDYTVLRALIGANYINILGIGGAVSVDRIPRQINKWGWFPGEGVEFRTKPEYLDQFKDIHYLVTHTAADNVEPYVFNRIVYHFANNDDTLLDDLRMERKRFYVVLDHIIRNNSETIRQHFYGHFHFSALTWVQGIKHTLLNVNELAEAHVTLHNYIDDDGEGTEPSGDSNTPDGPESIT